VDSLAKTAHRLGVPLLLVIAYSCCTDFKLRVGDLSGRIDFGYRAAMRFDVDLKLRVAFDGNFSGYLGFDAASAINLGFDARGYYVVRQSAQLDMDDDGVLEEVRVMAFVRDGASEPDRTFFAWSGDRYSYDEGRCYVLYGDGDTVVLLNGRCGSAEPALHCEMTLGHGDTMVCDVCDEAGRCASCGAEIVEECVAQGSGRLPSGTGGQPALDAGADAAIDAAIDGSVSIGLSLCQEQLRMLEAMASRCGTGPLADATLLCEERLSDVNNCYLAVEGARLFGSECSTLRSQVCSGVF
jgi:hypothetical protein